MSLSDTSHLKMTVGMCPSQSGYECGTTTSQIYYSNSTSEPLELLDCFPQIIRVLNRGITPVFLRGVASKITGLDFLIVCDPEELVYGHSTRPFSYEALPVVSESVTTTNDLVEGSKIFSKGSFVKILNGTCLPETKDVGTVTQGSQYFLSQDSRFLGDCEVETFLFTQEIPLNLLSYNFTTATCPSDASHPLRLQAWINGTQYVAIDTPQAPTGCFVKLGDHNVPLTKVTLDYLTPLDPNELWKDLRNLYSAPTRGEADYLRAFELSMPWGNVGSLLGGSNFHYEYDHSQVCSPCSQDVSAVERLQDSPFWTKRVPTSLEENILECLPLQKCDASNPCLSSYGECDLTLNRCQPTNLTASIFCLEGLIGKSFREEDYLTKTSGVFSLPLGFDSVECDLPDLLLGTCETPQYTIYVTVDHTSEIDYIRLLRDALSLSIEEQVEEMNLLRENIHKPIEIYTYLTKECSSGLDVAKSWIRWERDILGETELRFGYGVNTTLPLSIFNYYNGSQYVFKTSSFEGNYTEFPYSASLKGNNLFNTSLESVYVGSSEKPYLMCSQCPSWRPEGAICIEGVYYVNGTEVDPLPEPTPSPEETISYNTPILPTPTPLGNPIYTVIDVPITIEGSYTIESGSLIVSAPLVVKGSLVVSSGSLLVLGESLVVEGSLEVRSGAKIIVESSGTIQSLGCLDLEEGAKLILSNLTSITFQVEEGCNVSLGGKVFYEGPEKTCRSEIDQQGTQVLISFSLGCEIEEEGDNQVLIIGLSVGAVGFVILVSIFVAIVFRRQIFPHRDRVPHQFHRGNSKEIKQTPV